MIATLLLLVGLGSTPPDSFDGIEVTWRVTRVVEARGDGARDGATEERWALRLAPDQGLGRLDRGAAASCLVDTERESLTWIDHRASTRRTTSIGDGLEGLYGDVGGRLEPLRVAFTAQLEPVEPSDGELAAWKVVFPNGPADRLAASFAVQERPPVEAWLWRTVMRWCTAFDLDRSLWLDALVDDLPGPVTRLEIVQVGHNHRSVRSHTLVEHAPAAWDPDVFAVPEGYAEQPFVAADFVQIDLQ